MAKPTSEELANLYRSYTEEQLLDAALAYDSLTEIAQAALRAEFSFRRLDPPELPDPMPVPATQALAIVGRYRDLPQAQLAKCALDSAGIPSYLRDENTIRVEWAWSNLRGGIRLQVAAADLEAAQAILAEPAPGTLWQDDVES